MSFETTITGLKELLDKLNINVDDVIPKATGPVLEKAEQKLATYPSAPPHSHRTGNLGRSWAIQTSPGATFLRSSASYAQFVVGPEKTANGWQNVEQVAEAITPDATAAVEQAITDLLS